jgi:hypothetical protein
MSDDQTQHPVDAGLVETMITAFFDALDEQIDNTEPDRYYELWASLDGYRAAMRHAIVATGGAVLDPETVQAVRRRERLVTAAQEWREKDADETGSLMADVDRLNAVTELIDAIDAIDAADLARIAAALPKEADDATG